MFRHVALSLFCLLPVAALAQDVTGSISGSVIDPAGAAVVGASLKLVSDATAAVEMQAANGEGNFLFTTVKPGFYSITVEHPGFKKFEKSHIELTPGEKLVSRKSLTVGWLGERDHRSDGGRLA